MVGEAVKTGDFYNTHLFLAHAKEALDKVIVVYEKYINAHEFKSEEDIEKVRFGEQPGFRHSNAVSLKLVDRRDGSEIESKSHAMLTKDETANLDFQFTVPGNLSRALMAQGLTVAFHKLVTEEMMERNEESVVNGMRYDVITIPLASIINAPSIKIVDNTQEEQAASHGERVRQSQTEGPEGARAA